MRCSGVRSNGKMTKGVYRVKRCKEEGLVPLMATKTINIPGVIQANRGDIKALCYGCYKKAGGSYA